MNASRGEPLLEETPDVVRARRFRALDAWRGICALCVAVLHFPSTGFISSSAIIQNAGRFVDFFFVLSGFVIAYAFRRQLEAGAWRSFVVRRIGRLWPLHVTMLAVMVAIALAASAAGLQIYGESYWAIPANLTMTQAWGYLDYLSWNGPSWSISTEMLAYLLFALLALTAKGRALDLACTGVHGRARACWLSATSSLPTSLRKALIPPSLSRCPDACSGSWRACLRTACGERAPSGQKATSRRLC